LTIDERLEALTQSVELMAHMQLENEKQRNLDLAKTVDSLRKLAEAQAKTEEAQAKTEKTVNRIGRYAMLIARDHETGLALEDEGDSDE
jgi:hypothetical protein